MVNFNMKLKNLLIPTLFLLSSSSALAECYISYKGSVEIKDLISARKFVFDEYPKLCEKLKQNNAGLALTGTSQISPYQTTSAVVIALYPLDREKSGVTAGSEIWIGYEGERTTSALRERMYSLTMHGLNELSKNPNKLNELFADVRNMRQAQTGTRTK